MDSDKIVATMSSWPGMVDLIMGVLGIWVVWEVFRWWTKDGPWTRNGTHPGPVNYPFVGCQIEYLKNLQRIHTWTTDYLQEIPGNTMRQELAGRTLISTANPANVQHILKTNADKYPKGEALLFPLRDFLGSGILNVEGEAWKHQRQMINREFSASSLRRVVIGLLRDETHNRLLPLLSASASADAAHGRKSSTFDLQDVLVRFGFDFVSEMTIAVAPGAVDPSFPENECYRALNDAKVYISTRFFVPTFLWRLCRFLNIGFERKLKVALQGLENFCLSTIQTRKQELLQLEESKDDRGGQEPGSHDHSTHSDYLSRYILRAQEELISDTEIKDMVCNVLLAGKDTTSSALTYFFWVLDSQSQVELKILDEIKSILSARTPPDLSPIPQPFTYDELKKMYFLQATLHEVLRLYAPTPVSGRVAAIDDVLPDGTKVRKGDIVYVYIYAMGRMESIWGPDVMDFKPERWIQNGVFVPKDPFEFSVFSCGPRICPGKDLALLTMKYVAASVLSRFKVKVSPDVQVQYNLAFTIKMKKGLQVTVECRS